MTSHDFPGKSPAERLDIALFNEVEGHAEDHFVCLNRASGERLRVSWADGTPIIDDSVDVCEPEPCVFLMRGWHDYVVTLKPDAESITHMRRMCRPVGPGDFEVLAAIRSMPAKEMVR